MRLIDADALIEKWYEVNNIGPEDCGARFIGYTEIPRFINNAPTVEPTGDLISRAAEYSKPLQTTLNSDLVSRADAIDAVAQQWLFEASVESPYVNDDDIGEYRKLAEALFEDVPSAELPKGDLISRADAIAYIDRVTNSGLGRNKSLDYVHKYISALPSADAVQGWIPCSERLPECGFGLHYLVTLKDGHDFMDDVYEAFFDKYGWHVGDNELACDDIIAWMPLPKPYKGGEDK